MKYICKQCANPELSLPNEPCNDFEHPVRWALVAYWEKARADRAEAQRDKLLAALADIGSFVATGGEHSNWQVIVNNMAAKAREAIKEVEES